MYQNVKLPNKDSNFFPCSSNKILIQDGIKCPKCLKSTNMRRHSKVFPTCKSLFFHLICAHNEDDETMPPTKLDCVAELQRISDGMTNPLKIKEEKPISC